MLRGTGLEGLGGIRPKRSIGALRLISPMLECSRSDVESYLKEQGLCWEEDETNADTAILRNRVRHELLPYLETFSPDVVTRLSRMAETLSVDSDWVSAQEEIAFRGRLIADGELDVNGFVDLELALQRRVIRSWLRWVGVADADLSKALIERVRGLAVHESSGGEAPIGGGGMVCRRDNRLLRDPEELEVHLDETLIPIPGRVELHDLGLVVKATVGPVRPHEPPSGPGQWPAVLQVSADVLDGRSLMARSRRDGDRMRPLGVAGSKKIQDIFVDERVPVSLRDRIPLFFCEGEIVGVPGYRVAEGWEVPPESQSVHIQIASLS